MSERIGRRLPAPCTVNIACDGWTQPRHDIVIHEDWTVTTPHDLDADRVAIAFGGAEHSCIHLDTEVFNAQLAFISSVRQLNPQFALRQSPLTPTVLDYRHIVSHVDSPTGIDIVCALVRQFGNGANSAHTRATAEQFLAEAAGVDILWDDGTPARYAVARWYALGRPAGRVSAFDVLHALRHPDASPPPFIVGEPTPASPMERLDGDLVIPGIVSSVLRAPTFIEVFDGIAASPRPDHDPNSLVPGCSRWSPSRIDFQSTHLDRTWARSLAGVRAGKLLAHAGFSDGMRTLALRVNGPGERIPVAGERQADANPVDPVDPLYLLSQAMKDAAHVGKRRANLSRCNTIARHLHEAGEYRATITWLLYAYQHQRPPWAVRIILTLYGLALRGFFRDDGVRSIVSRQLLLAAPELYGLPREFTHRAELVLAPTAVAVDLRVLERRTRVWLRSILIEMAPEDHGRRLLAAVQLTRRPHDLACTWGPDTATFQYSRVGSDDPIWEATAEPTPRTMLIHVAFLLAYADVTGSAEILPPVDGDTSKPTVRKAYLWSVLTVDELRRLTSVTSVTKEMP